jgi:hypothetical protein
MADRVRRTYRGQSYTAKSSRPGHKRVHVKGHCRRKATVADRIMGSYKQAKEWGF